MKKIETLAWGWVSVQIRLTAALRGSTSEVMSLQVK